MCSNKSRSQKSRLCADGRNHCRYGRWTLGQGPTHLADTYCTKKNDLPTNNYRLKHQGPFALNVYSLFQTLLQGDLKYCSQKFTFCLYRWMSCVYDTGAVLTANDKQQTIKPRCSKTRFYIMLYLTNMQSCISSQKDFFWILDPNSTYSTEQHFTVLSVCILWENIPQDKNLADKQHVITRVTSNLNQTL